MDIARSLLLSNPNIRRIPERLRRIQATQFTYAADQHEVNAWASGNEDGYHITLCGGLCRAFKGAAIVGGLADLTADSSASESLRRRYAVLGRHLTALGWSVRAGDLRPSQLFATDVVSTEALVRKARTYFVGMAAHVLAHELGHVMLSHTESVHLPGGGEEQREREMQADSFAREMMATVAFESDIAFAGFLSRLLFAWLELQAPPRAVTTHPGAVRRLKAIVEENASLQQRGITLETLGSFLPEGALP